MRVGAQAGNQLATLRISHCTLVPGLSLLADGSPLSPDQPSLIVEVADTTVTVNHTILGGVRAVASATVAISDSILDATATTNVAYAATDNTGPGGALSLNAVTVIGKVNAQQVGTVSNSILIAALAAGDGWKAPVIATRRQTGCVRFSYLPAGARLPRRYECLPDPDADPRLSLPVLTSLRYGAPGYGQLAAIAGASLQTGADDEGQPGAFHSVYAPQRERNLQVRLTEYLRASLEAGIFHAS
jgi:hypothetical protein